MRASVQASHGRRIRRWWLAFPTAFLVMASAAAYAGWVPFQLFQSPWDKTVHFLAFGALALTLPPWLPARFASLAIWMPLALAGADEWSQSFSRNRTPDVWDFAADAAGIVLAALIHARWRAPATTMKA